MPKKLLKADKIKFDPDNRYYIGFNKNGEIFLDEYGFKKEFSPITKLEVYKKNKSFSLKKSLQRMITLCSNEKNISETMLIEIILQNFFKEKKCKDIRI